MKCKWCGEGMFAKIQGYGGDRIRGNRIPEGTEFLYCGSFPCDYTASVEEYRSLVERTEVVSLYLNGTLYGTGDLEYMNELFRDYVVTMGMYNQDEVEFSVKRNYHFK